MVSALFTVLDSSCLLVLIKLKVWFSHFEYLFLFCVRKMLWIMLINIKESVCFFEKNVDIIFRIFASLFFVTSENSIIIVFNCL